MANNKKRVAFYTLGCRVNQYETRAAEEAFQKAGFEIGSFDEPCDVYVINTCTVTAESDRKSRQMIRRAKKIGGSDAIVLAMGCMVQVNPDKAKELDGLDYGVGTRNKMDLVEKAIKLLENKKKVTEIVTTDFTRCDTMEKMVISGADTTRVFLKISDGCNNNCSYCIIPKARGNVCSKSVDEVKAEIKGLCLEGYREIVLTGVETVAYGKDMENIDLSMLVCEVNSLDCPIYRIRLGSIEPTFIKEETVKRLASCKKMMPHYHMSLQSGCDSVLAGMRRKYNTARFLKGLSLLREHIPNVTFTTDIIVGFPGETEEMFQKTCDYVRECGFLYVHIFPYSDRDGTDASKMNNKVPEDVKKDRAARLKTVMLEVRREIVGKYLGTVRPVLIENVRDGVATGHTDNFIEVRFRCDLDTGIQNEIYTGIQKNSVINVRLTELSEDLEYVNGQIV